ncbi:MAG: hypothetical protein QOI63_772 [Thermoplasmata archaeon]|jgi:hypothetical protein|nr:hypothetical protein [Thermoplasmata archaeon]
MSAKSDSVTPATVAVIAERMAKAGLLNLKVDLATVVGSLRDVAIDDPGDLICWNAYVFIHGPHGPRFERDLATIARLEREVATLARRELDHSRVNLVERGMVSP